MLTSQALVLATAMAASAGTFIIFNLFQDKYSPLPSRNTDLDSHVHSKQALKSCLSSGKKKDGNRGKRVRFAEDVKDSRRDLEGRRLVGSNSCGKEMTGLRRMPANRVALYSGILKDRFQRMEYSY